MLLDISDKGLPMTYDEESQDLVYKDNRVPFKDVIAAYDSGMNKVDLTDNLLFKREDDYVHMGCLKITETQFKLLRRKIINKQKQLEKCKS
jgi:hypothetical protein